MSFKKLKTVGIGKLEREYLKISENLFKFIYKFVGRKIVRKKIIKKFYTRHFQTHFLALLSAFQHFLDPQKKFNLNKRQIRM